MVLHKTERTEGLAQLPNDLQTASKHTVSEEPGTPTWGKSIASSEQSKSIWLSYERNPVPIN